MVKLDRELIRGCCLHRLLSTERESNTSPPPRCLDLTCPFVDRSSLDYNILTHGQVKLLTPRVPTNPADWTVSALSKSHPDILETVVNVGDVCVPSLSPSLP